MTCTVVPGTVPGTGVPCTVVPPPLKGEQGNKSKNGTDRRELIPLFILSKNSLKTERKLFEVSMSMSCDCGIGLVELGGMHP